MINEYDARTSFYKRFPAEDLIRSLADTYKNSYNIAIFAFCRELEKKKYDYLSVPRAEEILRGEKVRVKEDVVEPAKKEK